MRSYKLEGIIIKRRNVGEADRILTVMTKENGKIQVKAVGVRRITSRRSSHVEMLNTVSMTLYRGSRMPLLTEVVSLEDFSEIKCDLRKVGVAYHVCELIDALCPENQENEAIYVLFKELIENFSGDTNLYKAVYQFEVKLLELLGYWPQNNTLSEYEISPFIESILERKLKTRQILPRLL